MARLHRRPPFLRAVPGKLTRLCLSRQSLAHLEGLRGEDLRPAMHRAGWHRRLAGAHQSLLALSAALFPALLLSPRAVSRGFGLVLALALLAEMLGRFLFYESRAWRRA